MKKMILQGVLYTKQILPVSTFMELNGFLIGSAIKYIWTFKVDTPTAGRPVLQNGYYYTFANTSQCCIIWYAPFIEVIN